jgi:hypothetical protein
MPHHDEDRQIYEDFSKLVSVLYWNSNDGMSFFKLILTYIRVKINGGVFE